MTRIFALFVFSLLLFNVQTINAAEQKSAPVKDAQQNTYNVSDDFNFDNNITDAQLEQQAQDLKKIEDDNNGFDSRIINSSHFSSGTATKTWIPINKSQE